MSHLGFYFSKPLLQYVSVERCGLIDHFFHEISHVNAHITSGMLPTSLCLEFLRSDGPAILTLLLALVASATYAIYFVNSRPILPLTKKRVLLGTEVLAIIIAIVPIFLPFKMMRFVYGLVCFVIFMCLHSKALSVAPINSTYKDMLLSVFSFNIKEFLLTKTSTLPSSATLLRWACLMLLIDTCNFLACEAVPIYITGFENQTRAIALITGYWIYLSVEFHYTQTIILYDLIGAPMPINLRHKNPFLSISLSEFWGVRWNPIVGKLLQTSFYKPFRKEGFSRAFCVLSCFAGSGILHAYPVYISTKSLNSSAMMGAFFVLMGVLVVIEQAFFAIMGLTRKSAARPFLNSHLQLNARIKIPENIESGIQIEKWIDVIPYISDLCTIICVSGIFYCFSEGQLSLTNATLFLVPMLLPACTVLSVQINRLLEEEKKQSEREMINPMEGSASNEIDLLNTYREKIRSNDSEIDPSTSLSCESTVSAMSYTSVTDVILLSLPTSRNTSFNSSEKFLQSSSEKILSDAAIKLLNEVDNNFEILEVEESIHIEISLYQYMQKTAYIICGWIWTIGVIAILLPLFSLPVSEIIDIVQSQSTVIGPLVRTMHYMGWI